MSVCLLDIEQRFKNCLKKLDMLQSNKAFLKSNIELQKNNIDSEKTTLIDTEHYLKTSGLSLDDVNKKLSFIHITGTKGKGSTCFLTESIIRHHGYSTGVFTSPHLISVTERIKINGKNVDKETFVDVFERVYDRLEKNQQYYRDMPPYFCFLTILSFHIFIEKEVDVVVLEVGIGGKYDCTNVIGNPVAVGITSLELEHTEILGNTIEEIATQKAGIIKPSALVFANIKQQECLKIIQNIALKNNAVLSEIPEFYKYFVNKNNTINNEDIIDNDNILELNGSLSIQLACAWLKKTNKKNKELYFDPNNIKMNNNILNGLLNSYRTRQFKKINNISFYLDGAHTINSLNVSSNWYLKAVKQQTIKILFFNMRNIRNSEVILKNFKNLNIFDVVCFMPNIAFHDNKHNNMLLSSVNKEQYDIVYKNYHIWKNISQNSNTKCFHFKTILSALEYVYIMFDNQELEILITGSFYLIGNSISAINKFYKKNVLTV